MVLALVASVGWGQDRPVAAVLGAGDRLDLGAIALAPSPDGSLVLVWGPDRVVVTTAAGPPGAPLELEGVVAGAVANDGRVAVAHDGGVTVHAASGKEELRLGGFGRVSALALSPDGRWLAVGSARGLALHDAVDGRLAWSDPRATEAVAFTPAGRSVVARMEGQPRGFGLAKGAEVKETETSEPAGFLPSGCAPEEGGACPVPGAPALEQGDRLLVVHDGALERWRLLGADDVAQVPVQGPAVAAVWAGEDVVIALDGGQVERRPADAGAPALEVLAPGCGEGCALSGVGGLGPETWVVGPGGLQRWDAGGAPLVKRPRPTGQISVDRLADGRFVSLGDDGRLRVGEAPGQGRVLGALSGALGADGAGDVVAAWSAEGLLLVRADGGPLPSPAVGAGRAPESVALSPDGARVAVIDDQGALHVYRTADGTGELGLPLGLGGHVLAWSSDGQRLFAARDGIRAFSAADGAEVGMLALGSELRAVEVSAAGTLLARTADGVVTVDPAVFE